MKLKPLGKRILIQRQPEDSPLFSEVNLTGLHLPDDYAEKRDVDCARVIALGEGASDVIQVGDTLLVKRYAGNDITLDGQKYEYVREEDVLATVEQMTIRKWSVKPRRPSTA
jgi:chaperonin GroES